jgi:aspartyl-tRNA(Asn)/glutamyl-tRNA(Gln) amidotransferase subunit B
VKNINSFRFMEKAVESEIKRQRAILESGGKVAQENRGFNETRGETVAQRSKEEAKDYRYFPEPDIPPMVFDDEYLSSLSGELPRLPYDIKKEYVEKHGLTQNAANVLVDNLGLEAVKKFEDLVSTGVDPIKAANAVINKRDIGQETEKIQVPEDEIRRIVLTYPKAIEDYKKGKENSIQFLVGMVARETKGKADPKSTFDTIKKVLSEL